MKGLVKAQFSIGIRKQGFQFSFLLMLIYAIATSLYYCSTQIGYEYSGLYNASFLSGINVDSDFAWFFCRIMPFIIVLPSGFSLFNDYKIRIVTVLQSKYGVKKYYISKIISVFILGFIVFAVPFVLEYLLNLVIIPGDAGNTITNWPMYTNVYFDMGSSYLFPEIFAYSPTLYLMVSIVLTGIFGGCASVFIASFAVFRVQFKILFFLPLYMFIYVISILADTFGNKYYVFDAYIMAFDGVFGKSLFYYIAIMIFLLTFGCGLIMSKSYMDQI